MTTFKITTKSSILNNTKFNIFSTEHFLSQQSSEYGWIHNDLFLIPFYINRKYIFKSLVFTSDAISLASSINEDEKQLFLDSIINEIPKLVKVDSILCPPSYVLFDHCPKGSKFCEFGSYRIDLSNSEDDLFSNLHSKHRNVIRKAIKDGVEIHFGKKHLKQCYDVIYNTHNRQKLFFPTFNEIKKLYNSLGYNLICAVSYKNNIIQGGALIPWNENYGYYLFGGSIEKPFTGSMNYLQWEVILKLKNLKVAQYDFVGARLNPKKGSKIEGIQRFKHRFGSELHKGYLWKHDYFKTKRVLYNMLVFLKNKSFPHDIIADEN